MVLVFLRPLGIVRRERGGEKGDEDEGAGHVWIFGDNRRGG
jgi:hypothetical protein